MFSPALIVLGFTPRPPVKIHWMWIGLFPITNNAKLSRSAQKDGDETIKKKRRPTSHRSLDPTLFKTYHFAPPIFGIGVENKAALIREAKVKYKQKGHDGKDG